MLTKTVKLSAKRPITKTIKLARSHIWHKCFSGSASAKVIGEVIVKADASHSQFTVGKYFRFIQSQTIQSAQSILLTKLPYFVKKKNSVRLSINIYCSKKKLNNSNDNVYALLIDHSHQRTMFFVVQFSNSTLQTDHE